MSGHSADLAEHIKASTINCLCEADRLEILNQQLTSSTVDVPLLGRCGHFPVSPGCRPVLTTGRPVLTTGTGTTAQPVCS
jgi:hypothetical protein